MDKHHLLSNYIRKDIFLVPKNNNSNNIDTWIVDLNYDDKYESEFEKALQILSENKKFMDYFKKLFN